MLKFRKEIWFVILALVSLIVGFAPETLAAGSRMAAHIDEPFEVQGRLFSAGTLTLRELRAYSPIALQGEIWVDGACIGLMIAPAAGAQDADAIELLFERGERGHLVLVGVSAPETPALVAHLSAGSEIPMD